MQSWTGSLWVVALASGVAIAGTGCGSSADVSRKDAAQGADVPVSSGGAAGIGAGTGGITGAGGIVPVATGGVVGAGGIGPAPSGGAVTGGITTTALGGGPGIGGTLSMGGHSATGNGGSAGGSGGSLAGGGGDGMAAGGMGGGSEGRGGATSAGGAGGIIAMDAGVDGVQSSIVYSGCGYGGDIERAVVARFDALAGTCVTLVLESPHRAPDASLGMTISNNWGVAALVEWPSSANDCATRNPPASALGVSSASGSVTVNRSSGTIDIDAVFEFPITDWGAAQSIEMRAQGVDYMHNC